MPSVFLDWQLSERQAIFKTLAGGRIPTWFAAHLPVVSTLSGPEARHPIRSATKGVGLLPRAEFLPGHTEALTLCLERLNGKDPIATRNERIRAGRLLYESVDEIDPTLFGTLEIFHGQTFRNLRRDPRAAVLFTGPGPSYLSYQFNCQVEVVSSGNPHFAFILAMRQLFEHERFHIQQPRSTFGYIFHIDEVFQKTPLPLPSRS